MTPDILDDSPIVKPRRRKIEEVCQAATVGIQTDVNDFSGAELCCGVLTLALRTIITILQAHPECANQMRQAVMPLLLACADTTKAPS